MSPSISLPQGSERFQFLTLLAARATTKESVQIMLGSV
jgi:hypothetical protein